VRHERQVQLLRRLAEAGEDQHGLFAPASRVQAASTYTDPQRFDEEQRVLFRRGPVLAALSAEVPAAGDYVSAWIGGVPIVVVRQRDGSVRGFVNACRHRGAPVFADAAGNVRGRVVCGYHGWTYELDGALASRPHAHGAFDDVTDACSLHPIAVAERYGMVFARPGSTDPIDVDSFLCGAQDDLGAFGFERAVPIESRTHEWRMNWKLVLDTFGESYHIRTLHAQSIAPAFDSGCTIFEPFGPHLVNIGFRKAIVDELTKPAAEQRLLPYATAQYFLVPNAMLCHQIDHLELWRVEPIDVRTTRVTTTVLASSGPVTESAERYLRKNLDVLLDVTGREDFPLMERIQVALDSGALPSVVYGKIEPALVHFHASLDAALSYGVDGPAYARTPARPR
jgi:phenylpropionate dioxygenase-like ring-hydroxylating dioxygenase large terminal subunit